MTALKCCIICVGVKPVSAEAIKHRNQEIRKVSQHLQIYSFAIVTFVSCDQGESDATVCSLQRSYIKKSMESDCACAIHFKTRQCGMCIAEKRLLSDAEEIGLQLSMEVRCCNIVTRHR